MTRVRALAIVLTLSLLLIPATCANAAGPHSIFMDPMASHMHHADSDDEHATYHVMTQAELEMHVLLGHVSMSEADAMVGMNAMDDERAAELVKVAAPKAIEKDPCQGGPRLKDLPSSMAMAAAMNPITLNELDAIVLPSAAVPVASSLISPAPRAHTPESPPPQG